MSGLVMLLPHGYEGQGPEHSNAYVERLLNLCADDNIQVANATTPAQYFHLLRRQIHRRFRKPLVIFTPKALLRYEPSFSKLTDLTEGQFQSVIDDVHADREKVRRVLLCTGKVYYTLLAAREKGDCPHCAIVRVEQLYPLPEAEIRAAAANYPRVEEIGWVQEEPENRGAWTFIEPRLRNVPRHFARLLRAQPQRQSGRRIDEKASGGRKGVCRRRPRRSQKHGSRRAGNPRDCRHPDRHEPVAPASRRRAALFNDQYCGKNHAQDRYFDQVLVFLLVVSQRNGSAQFPRHPRSTQ